MKLSNRNTLLKFVGVKLSDALCCAALRRTSPNAMSNTIHEENYTFSGKDECIKE